MRLASDGAAIPDAFVGRGSFYGVRYPATERCEGATQPGPMIWAQADSARYAARFQLDSPWAPSRAARLSGSSGPLTTEPTATPTPAAEPAPHPVSLPALMEKRYDGRNLRLRQVLDVTDAYTKYSVTYRGSGLPPTGWRSSWR
jgi:hypothetical protein